MILSRVIEHVKAQHWTAVSIDFVIVIVIVVLGVFVGLQVQEWNAARGHRAAEIGYLNSMEEDVVYPIGNLQQLLVNMERQQVAHAALYEYSVDPGAALGLQSDDTEATYRFSDPLLIANFDMASVFSRPRPDGTKQPIPWLKRGPRTSPPPAVMKSMPFRNAVLYRSFFTGARIASVRRLLEQHRRIAELIDARQVELEGAP